MLLKTTWFNSIKQVFDNTPASKEGTLQSGDEIIGVDNVSVKGKTKSEVAKMIQASQGFVSIIVTKWLWCSISWFFFPKDGYY